MSNKKNAAVVKAVATIKKSMTNDTEKVSVTGSTAQAMQQSASWATATDVQASVKTWTAAATNLDTNAKAILALRAQLVAAELKQEGFRRDWAAAKTQVLSNVTVFCGGNPETVTGFNLDILSRARIGVLEAPINLAVNPGAGPGEAVGTWAKGVAIHGFVVQHATDPTNAATVSAPTPSTKVRFTLGGLPSGANVSMRVAAIDPASATGQSPWSAWVVGNAR